MQTPDPAASFLQNTAHVSRQRLVEQHYSKQRHLLAQDGRFSINSALGQLKHCPAETMAETCIDHHRWLRTGVPELICGASKAGAQIRVQITSIAESSLPHTSPVPAA